jgi:TetR/AcrR family transcriptional regulator, cholesterol catabolism regulator
MGLNEIIEKVSVLFTKYGVKSVSMDDISRQLGISKKTLYQFVNDKEDLVAKAIGFEKKRMQSCFSNALDDSSRNAIQHLLDVGKHVQKIIAEKNPSLEYDLNKYYPEIYKEFHDFRNKMMYNSVLKNLVQGKKEGLYRKELDVEFIARFYISRVEMVIESETATESKEYPAEFFIEIFIYHIHGVSNEKGLEFLKHNMQELSNYNLNKNPS